MSPPKMRLRDFPEYLRKRIQIGTGSESKACWVWTGKTKAARQRHRPYPAIDRHREHAGRITREAAVPIVRHPVTKSEEDARRHVYGAATMVPVCDVPTLRRYCDNPRCVSPHHVMPGIPTAAQRKRIEVQSQPALEPEIEAEAPAVAEEFTPERCLELLRVVDDGEGVSWSIEKDDAADEAGIPRDALTDETWAQYVREEMEKEEADAA